MDYQVTVDPTLCGGFGSCVDTAPDLFELEAGIARPLRVTTDDPRVFDARDACPMGAISVAEVPT